MKKENFNKLIILFLIIILTGLVFYYFAFKDHYLNEIEDWDSYIEISDSQLRYVGAGDCGSPEFELLKEKVITGEMKRKIFDGDLELLFTPNYFNWSNEKFLVFNDDLSAICGAGGRYPFRAYEDKLLWIGSCGSGKSDQQFFECEKVKERLERSQF